MSLSASQSHAADLHTAHTSPAQTASSTSSPPSFAGALTRGPVTLAATTSFPTPASSICGRAANAASMDGDDGLPEPMDFVAARHSPSRANGNGGDRRGDGDWRDKRPDEPMDLADDDPDAASFYRQPLRRPTNHDRQGPSPQQSPDPAHGAPPRVADPPPFTAEFGRAFHLCKRNYQPTAPNLGIDLISLYGLGPVARTVARNDLVTGEKINRLRKSYEGKIKPLALAGRNKPARHEPGTPGALLDLLALPADEWLNQKVAGKEIRAPEPDSAPHRLLARALRCEPGALPNAPYWEDLLGHEKAGKAGDRARRSVSVVEGARREGNGSPVSALNSAAPSPSFAPSEYASSRPRRAGKKRSYHDSSFMGYGEGFVDDDGEGESVYDEDGGKGKKRRRKAPSPPVYPPTERGGSYGVGMFGYGAR